ncbi:MAG: hypothetical protein ACTSXL_03175 [Alphaproteobacteria bacterium]|nr:MAG: hypothetical protein B6I23_00635 [Rickettsiaceae bacterium 4572_127]
MKIEKKITENDFIDGFLKAEIKSERFGEKLNKILKKFGTDKEIIINSNLTNQHENKIRKNILKEFRGYSKNEAIFENFPEDITWYDVKITKAELQQIKYINWDYWLDISNNTRSPVEAVKKIRIEKINTPEVQRFIRASNSLKGKNKFPPIIAVAKSFDNYLVVLEGHLRLTAYCLNDKYIPNELNIILGISQNITKWDLY